MIAVTFALPEESRDFRRAINAVRGEGGAWDAAIAGQRVRVVHCGVGPEAAARAVAKLLTAHRPRMVIATGFAGALDPTLTLGALVLGANVSAPALLERAQQSAVRVGVLTSVALPVDSPAAKRALAAVTGATAVDMETAAISAACVRAGVPLLAVRAISDLASDPLPVPFAEWFDLARQRPRPVALVWYLARHPRQFAPFVRFVRGLRVARHALAGFLLQFLEAEANRSGESAK